MGLLDVLNGMQNGPRGPSKSATDSGGGMSPMTMAILALLAWKAVKHFGGSQPGAAPGPAPSPAPAPKTINAGMPRSGGLSDMLKGGLGGLLAGGAAGSILSVGLGHLLNQVPPGGLLPDHDTRHCRRVRPHLGRTGHWPLRPGSGRGLHHRHHRRADCAVRLEPAGRARRDTRLE